MLVSEFVKKSIEQDKRNVFEECLDDFEFLPEQLIGFYKKANPVDVEVNMDGNSVKMYPAEELESLQEDYSLGKECFVFATCNSDPIFMYGEKVYTCYHGSKSSEKELIAEDFDSFLRMID